MKYIVTMPSVTVDVEVEADSFDDAREIGRELFIEYAKDSGYRVELAE